MSSAALKNDDLLQHIPQVATPEMNEKLNWRYTGKK
jgi:hypothetical protein